MTGTTLTHYRITAELGRGGMGIVYLAEDTKLDRQVAIKVLPSSALASDDDRSRFYREAKAAAALNHPHIAQIYQIDEAVPEGGSGEEPRPFIAMEFIDGETLDARIKKGPLKLKEAVRLATQIAGALGEAHDKGIVHRDVKASNVMLTSKGDAKVLDFGLALTAASTKLTRMNSTLGTVAYMSPEQARGEEVDHRTDLWALGVVLYEMIAGRNPFGGDYEQAVVYSILNAEPEPLTAVRTGVPMELERIVNKLLSKDAGRRYATAADLRVDLEGALTDFLHLSRTGLSTVSPGQVQQADTESNNRVKRVSTILATAIVSLILGALLMNWLSPSEQDRLRRFHIPISGLDAFHGPRISPDGAHLAFVQRDSLTVRPIDRNEFIHVASRVRGFAWSPDGGRLAVFIPGQFQIWTVSDRSSRQIADLAEGFTYYPTWISESELIVSAVSGSAFGRLLRITSSGIAEPWSDSDVDSSLATTAIDNLEYLPGVNRVIGSTNQISDYLASSIRFLDRNESPIAGQTGSTEMSTMRGRGISGIEYAAGTGLLFSDFESGTWFSRQTGRASFAEPELLVPSLVHPSVSNDGILFGLQIPEWADSAGARYRLVWHDRDGRFVQTVDRSFEGGGRVRISDDMSKIYYYGDDLAYRVLDVEASVSERLFSAPELSPERFPVAISDWREDGIILAGGLNSSNEGLWLIHEDDPNNPLRFFESDMGVINPTLAAGDSLVVFRATRPETGRDIMKLPVAVEDGTIRPTGEPVTVVGTEAQEANPVTHPERPFVAFVVIEGDELHLRVAALDNSGRVWNVGRGNSPAWSRDGSRLLYMTPESIMQASFDEDGSRPVGRPEVLVELPDGIRAPGRDSWDSQFVHHEPTNRFLLSRERDGDQRTSTIELVVIENWQRLLD